jgi:CBS domain-containing protein
VRKIPVRYVIVSPETSTGKIKQASVRYNQTMFPVVTDTNLYLGYILMDDLEQHPDAQTAGEVLRQVRDAGQPRLAYAHGGDSYDDALVIMRAERLPFIPVVDYGGLFIGTADSSSGQRLRN